MAIPGLRDLSPETALATLEALFKSTQGYVVYRLRRVPFEESPLGALVEVVSPSIREIMGVEDPENLARWFEAVHPDDLPRVMEAQMASNRDDVPFDEVMRIVHGDDVRWIHAISHPVFDADGAPTHFNGLIVDVTDRMRAEAEAAELRANLDAAQRWQAVGALAASVAHDFNNLLQGILVTASTGRDAELAAEEQRALVDEVIGFVERGASLTGDLLGYTRTSSEFRPVDARPSVERTGRLLSRMFLALDVEVDVGDAELVVAVDPGELEQVLLNLGLNAAHATGERGNVRLRAARLSAAEATARTGSPVSDAMVLLEIEDDGEGIAPDDQARIFESFYTTKPQGKGTGLGLATARRMVERWAGLLLVRSAVGDGATFSILVPSREAPPSSAPVPEVRPGVGRGQGILLVDDEEPLRLSLARYLDRRGFDIAEAGSYVDAVGLWHAHPDRFRLLITDTVMPGRGGLEIVRHLRAIQPSMPVVVISGHADDASMRELRDSPNTSFLRKPFKLDELLLAIERLTEPPA